MTKEAGARLKKVVEEQMTIKKFIDEIGVARSTARSWFLGEGMSSYHLAKACELLNVSADYILFGRQYVIIMPENKLPFEMELK